MIPLSEVRIGIVGLGYVGLPLALAFGEHYPTVGYDIDAGRVSRLRAGIDDNRECDAHALSSATQLVFADAPLALARCNVYIVTVPTPVDAHKRPDFSPLIAASRMLGGLLKQGDTVIYESTVYPGATEEICVPELQDASGMRLNQGFFVGYSPERINPGDRARALTDIPKVTSGSTAQAAEFVDALYRSVIRAGTHKAPSVRVAEAAKVVENTQRDVNIALMNEFALMFGRLGIDTHDVLEAAATKWNFLPFHPGLVGGHCIGVDPYYLIQKSQEVGYYPDLLLASRRINDAMGAHVAVDVVKRMAQAGIAAFGARILILGVAFKEDTPDLRNTRVVELMRELESHGTHVEVHDPLADPEACHRAYAVPLLPSLPASADYDAVVLAVSHRAYRELGGAGVRALVREGGLVYDIKSALPRGSADARL